MTSDKIAERHRLEIVLSYNFQDFRSHIGFLMSLNNVVTSVAKLYFLVLNHGNLLSATFKNHGAVFHEILLHLAKIICASPRIWSIECIHTRIVPQIDSTQLFVVVEEA
jgi:hypothetical protein